MVVPLNSGGSLFLFQDGQPLPRTPLTRWIRQILVSAGTTGNFSSHSFRIGAVTAAASCWVPDHLIQALGRWSSNASQSNTIWDIGFTVLSSDTWAPWFLRLVVCGRSCVSFRCHLISWTLAVRVAEPSWSACWRRHAYAEICLRTLRIKQALYLGPYIVHSRLWFMHPVRRIKHMLSFKCSEMALDLHESSDRRRFLQACADFATWRTCDGQ